ncbi:diguanylate cyclase [Edaphobacter sp. HDX4]|uniref:ligand-binding sensor domain-containing diguanylate cyclase n=1 Tax=Edaphobacter sp. HDX4 TaxID=2794064 RepID=UPI002FE6543C
MRLALVLCLSAFFFEAGQAQQFSFTNYGQDEGLRNLDVFGLVEDDSGMLWLATENGLFRYDGSEFQHFGPKDGIGEPLVLGLYKDGSGRIWVATNDHLYALNGTRFVPAPLEASNMRFGAGQLIGSIDPAHILFLVRGSLMLLTENRQPGDNTLGWTVKPFFSDDNIKANPALGKIQSVLALADGTSKPALWFGCGNAICRLRDPLRPAQAARVEVFSESRNIPADSWTCLFLDRRGEVWARSRSHIRILAPGQSAFLSRDLPVRNGVGVYSGSGILTMAEDPQGAVLTQTNRGLARWEGSSWQLFDSTNGIDFKDVSSILFDRYGVPWFSTRGHGLFRWKGYRDVENWTIAQGLHDDVVWSIFRDSRRRLWIADQFQINQLSPNSRKLDTPEPFRTAPILHGTGFAESPDGSLWIFGLGGEVYQTNASMDHVLFRAKLPSLARVFTDSGHRIWILSRNGVYVIREPEQPVIEKVADPMLSSDAFDDAAETPNHDLWFLSDHQLYRLSHHSGHISRVVLDPVLTRGQMRNIAAARDGSLWIGGGIPALLHLHVQKGHITSLESVTVPDLASNDVQVVRFDRRGWLWVGTDMGVNVFDGRLWRLLTRRDGLISNDIDEGAFLADDDGSVWVGANGGVIHLLHPEHLLSKTPLDVRLVSATLGSKTLSLASTNLLPWQDAPLRVRFTSLNFAREGSMRFRYRLSGLEVEWNETGSNRIRYPAVPPGDYRLELQAIDPNQHAQSPVVSLRFTVRPPWWRTRAMYLLLGIASFGASILVWHWRENRLLQRQRILRKLVAQRTKELEAEKAELVATREALRHQATRDSLTGIWNRSAIVEILAREMDRSRRTGATLAVVLADIDHFKQINDTMGHLAGDAILRDAANRMLHHIRPYDFIGRYGGEEFLIVMPALSRKDAPARLNKLLQSISGEAFLFEEQVVNVTSSFGTAWYSRDMMHVDELIRRSDEALYRAKGDGRDRVVFYEDLDSVPGNVDH